MKVELKNEEKNIVKMEIEIPAEIAEKEYEKAVRKISNNVNIPGFRKGKAPKNIIEKQYGTEAIKYEALETLLPGVLNQIITENKLDVITQPSVDSFTFELGKDLKLTATVELKPQVELGEYKGMTVDVEAFKHADDAFDKCVDSFLERHAELKDVTDRKANETDICVIDFDGYVDGEKINGGEGKDYSLDLGHSNFIPGFAEGIVGHSLNEEFDINVTFPELYHEASLAGKPAVFKIKLNKIQERVLPELNDEFVSKTTDFKTVDEFKEDITKFLESKKTQEDDALTKKAVFEKVLENTKVDIQDSMIEREAQELLNEYKQRLASQGFRYEDVMKTQDEEKMMADIRKDAELRLKSTLVIEKIAKDEKIGIETADFDEKLAQTQRAYQLDKNTMLEHIKQNPNIISGITQQIMSEKVIDFLTENNTINLK